MPMRFDPSINLSTVLLLLSLFAAGAMWVSHVDGKLTDLGTLVVQVADERRKLDSSQTGLAALQQRSDSNDAEAARKLAELARKKP